MNRSNCMYFCVWIFMFLLGFLFALHHRVYGVDGVEFFNLSRLFFSSGCYCCFIAAVYYLFSVSYLFVFFLLSFLQTFVLIILFYHNLSERFITVTIISNISSSAALFSAYYRWIRWYLHCIFFLFNFVKMRSASLLFWLHVCAFVQVSE